MLGRDLVVVVASVLQGGPFPDPIALFHQDLSRFGVVEALLPKKRAKCSARVVSNNFCCTISAQPASFQITFAAQ